ncbi:hypothetical protein AGLY_006127 [Aphis glycines]|uniref:Uncharacterized protein n=1 Tax=Aphis glycines TaxID=307491 RepID=A0A6G0TSY2_APHGL|nr:hypothetical protein AGLY_006127 [Aphis glycines]
MFYALLVFSLAVICVIRCNPLVNLKTSDTQNTSTILETLNTIDDLNIIQYTCSIDNRNPGKYFDTYYCEWLMKEKDNLTLKDVINIKINEIQSSLLTLLNLENKAIVCRSIRHLLPIIIYGIFINDVNGSTENENSRMNMINELFKKKSDILNNKTSSIEVKLQQIKTSTMKSDRSRNNKKLLRKKFKQNKGEFSETSSSILEKIKITVQLILPFIQKLDCFHNLYKIDKVMTTNEFDRNLLLLLILDEVKEMYRTECNVEVDVKAVFQNEDTKWIIESNYDSTLRLVEEIDRISMAIQKDLQFLSIKYFFVNDSKRLLWSHDVSLVFYHTFNKYYDPYIWKLIGDENIMVYASDSAKPITIDKVASDLIKQIKGTTDLLTAFVDNKVGCRCWTYLNVIIKLSYCSIRVLAANVLKVRERAGNVKEMLMFEKLQKTNQNKIYISLHDKINKLEITECFIDDDVSMIDELLDKDDVRKYFRSTYAIYWNRNAQSIATAIESMWNYTLSLGFRMEFSSILQEIHQIQVHPESDMKLVKYLVKWYKWGKQVHKDHCRLDDDLFTFSDSMQYALENMSDNTKMRLTLNWIMKMIDTLNEDLENDLTIISQEFYFYE